VKNIFIDINVVLDLFLERRPHHAPAQKVFILAEKKQIKILISAISFTTIHYLLSRHFSREEAAKILGKLRLLCEVAPVTQKIIDLAMTASFDDFEDAVQYYSASLAGAEAILTRNRDDFSSADIPVMSPVDFLALLEV